MTGTGLVGVPEPSELFGRTVEGEIGAAVACALEGSRPLLLEIQALVAPTDLAMPRRVGTGVDPKRLAMIVAVLSRHAGIALGQADVFVNVAGGVRIDEPGADLAIALAIVSAAKGAPVKPRIAAFGEIGLTGPPPAGDPGGAAARGVRQARARGRGRPAGTTGRGKLRILEAETLEASGEGGDRCRASRGRIGPTADPAAARASSASPRSTIRGSTRSCSPRSGGSRRAPSCAPRSTTSSALARAR